MQLLGGFFSSPIAPYREHFKVINDAFAIIDVNDTIDSSTISLYYQNSNKKDGFSRCGPYHLITGQPLDSSDEAKSPANYFTIGSTMGLLKGLPALSYRIKQGIDLRIKAENTQGGTNGTHIKTIILNDNYVPYRTKENVNYLLNLNIDTLLLPIGSPTLESYMNHIRQNKILVLFPLTGNPKFRSPDLKKHY